MPDRGKKQKKIRAAAAGGQETEARLVASPVRVIVTPLSGDLVHPLSRRDIQRVLSVLPEESVAGLRSVTLLDAMVTEAGYPVLSSYRRLGFIRLHAVPPAHWRIGPLPAGVVSELEAYGARVEATADGLVVGWSPSALRLFFTIGALLPAVARHRREMGGEAGSDPVVRALRDDAAAWPVSTVALQRWREFLS